jgi:cytochrome c peroxidase
VLDGAGARAGLAPAIEVGQGPTGVALDQPRERLYVLNRFEASISVVSTATELELARVPFFDPTPAALRAGRQFLYDARATSGLGLTACASCHADARMDRLAWDLGDPSGAMQDLTGVNQGANMPHQDGNFVDFHPMKGPMLTQTLQDIVGREPFHWRGDRAGIEAFNPAYESLLGDDERLEPLEMQALEDFLATIAFPPNPFRELDNSLSTRVSLAGLHTPGRFAPPGLPMPDGNAVNGRALFDTPVRFACTTCHTLPTGQGTNTRWNGTDFEAIAPGPNGEDHHSVHPQAYQIEQDFKIPTLRNLYERTGFDGTVAGNTAGFGYRNDGAIDSLPRFVARPHFRPENDQEVADIVAFLLSLSGETEVLGTVDVEHPPGSPGQMTHAAVGKQVTFDGAANPAGTALLSLLVAEAEQGDLGLVARGRLNGLERGFYYAGNDRFQSDRRGERLSRAALLSTAASGSELTLTAVPKGSERRIGADRDSDGALDRDELDLGFDPADPRSHPKAQRR